MLNASVGFTTEKNSLTAGKAVAKEALAGLSGKPKIAILAVDCLSRKKFEYNDVLKGVREEIGPETQLIGNSTMGVMVNNRFALKSVGLMLLGGDVNVDSCFHYEHTRQNHADIADDLLRIKKGLEPNPNRIMMMFQDGARFPPEMMDQQKMLNSRIVSLISGLVTRIFKKKLDEFVEQGKGFPPVQELVGRLYENGWDIPAVGNVNNNIVDFQNFEFHDGKVYEDAVVGAILSGSGSTKFGTGYAAGAQSTGKFCKPTKGVGGFLLKIDNKPALKGFCDAIGINPASLKELRNQGYQNVYNLLGTREKVGEKEIIHLTGTITNPEMENLVISGFPFNKVPEQVEIFQSNPKILLQSTKDGIMDAMRGINNPKFLLGFDCIARLTAYGDNYPRVMDAIRDTIGADVPRMIMGAGGEIFGTKPNDLYWNQFTLITVVGGD